MTLCDAEKPLITKDKETVMAKSDDLGLADAIEALRRELSKAVANGEGKDIRFNLGDIEVEFQTTIEKNASAQGGVEFWVVQLAAEGAVRHESVHTIRLKLEPVGESAHDESGAKNTSNRLKVSGKSKG